MGRAARWVVPPSEQPKATVPADGTDEFLQIVLFL
jgi:hypothetical protein